jgi:Arc/MetJ-type ribon-helix-helix transcriptional regulator
MTAVVPNRIPFWYHWIMTIQIAVRLPDDIVAFVDEQVSSGAATSRAAVVARALEHERRRAAANRDAAIYKAASQPHDLDELATWTAGQPMDMD